MIVAIRDSNTIQILDFDNLNSPPIHVKNVNKGPLNLMKFVKKVVVEKEECYQECLACFSERGDTSKIVIFENPKK